MNTAEQSRCTWGRVNGPECTDVVLVLVVLAVLISLAIPWRVDAAASGRVANSCDRAAERAARETGVPLDVLRALTRTETGRAGKTGPEPWPWTVNMEGTGAWFPDLDSALAHVFAHVKQGARSFDIGCFQINHRWHGSAFSSIEEMFQPEANAGYAARFLKALHDELGDWTAAAGAYHSRTPELAERYVARFERIRQRLGPVARQPGPVPQRDAPKRPRGWDMARRTTPLVGDGTQTNRGSLVPLNPGNAAPRPFLALLN